MADFDLAIIGGGINGAAIARDAAGRGLRVTLVEQGDLGGGTSSASSKLIHGGLRYLEQGAFKLVREGLRERAVLLKTAPHIVWPARFVLPHHPGLRPAWQLRLGLFLYDLLAGKSLLPGAHGVDLSHDAAGAGLQPRYARAFEYSDCCVDDARLVVLNALDAAERGAVIRTRTRFERAERQGDEWRIGLSNGTITARALVNATGPWMEQANAFLPQNTSRLHVKQVKGSHIVVRRLFDHGKAYIFQNGDGRIVFAIPYQRDFTLIGTTDYAFSGDPAAAEASSEEISYLCTLANDYFRTPITPADVVWSFAGVRALIDNRTVKAKNLSRDYVLQLECEHNNAPLLSIYGGKLTAARQVAEKALDRLRPFLPMQAAWTHAAPLPGGDFAWNNIAQLVQTTCFAYPFLAEAHATRLVHAYGTRVSHVLGEARSMHDLGTIFAGGLSEKEVRYLMSHEWAISADDILWRRSKLGLLFSETKKHELAAFMAGAQARA